MNIQKKNIFSILLSDINTSEFLELIHTAITHNQHVKVTYATAATLNVIYQKQNLIEIFNKFDFIHPDGVGVYIGSKILYGNKGFTRRFTGSDFYPFLIKQAVEKKWKLFFFGDSNTTLEKIKTHNLNLNVVGIQNGYDFERYELINTINDSECDILIVGLGCPKQELWIIENCEQLNTKVILVVGDGIKVFAGNKIRGPHIFRKLGFEWVIRLVTNFSKFWKRYLIGIPLFIFRIIKFRIE